MPHTTEEIEKFILTQMCVITLNKPWYCPCPDLDSEFQEIENHVLSVDDQVFKVSNYIELNMEKLRRWNLLSKNDELTSYEENEYLDLNSELLKHLGLPIWEIMHANSQDYFYDKMLPPFIETILS